MIRNDKIFGKLEYDYGWFGSYTILLFDKEIQLSLSVEGDDDSDFETGQYDAFNTFTKKLNDELYLNLLNKVLDYYNNRRNELGYNIESNEHYPEINTIDILLNHITFSFINVMYDRNDDKRRIGIGFDCTWDSENGVGITLIDEEIENIGYQDITF